MGVNDILSGAKMAHLRQEACLLSIAMTHNASPHLLWRQNHFAVGPLFPAVDIIT